MEKKTVYCYAADGSFLSAVEQMSKFLPNNATWDKYPGERPFPKNQWPVFNKETKKWEMKPDYRERKRPHGFLEEEEQEATLYYLPEDTWESQGRKMFEVGELPENSTTIKPEKPAELVLEENWASLRSTRDQKIAATDYMVLPDSTYTDEQKEVIQEYRQALRDITDQEGAPWDGGQDETPWPVLNLQ